MTNNHSSFYISAERSEQIGLSNADISYFCKFNIS